jgi:hypothetical protein
VDLKSEKALADIAFYGKTILGAAAYPISRKRSSQQRNVGARIWINILTHPVRIVSTLGGMPQDGQWADFLGNKQLTELGRLTASLCSLDRRL